MAPSAAAMAMPTVQQIAPALGLAAGAEDGRPQTLVDQVDQRLAKVAAIGQQHEKQERDRDDQNDDQAQDDHTAHIQGDIVLTCSNRVSN